MNGYSPHTKKNYMNGYIYQKIFISMNGKYKFWIFLVQNYTLFEVEFRRLSQSFALLSKARSITCPKQKMGSIIFDILFH